MGLDEARRPFRLTHESLTDYGPFRLILSFPEEEEAQEMADLLDETAGWYNQLHRWSPGMGRYVDWPRKPTP